MPKPLFDKGAAQFVSIVKSQCIIDGLQMVFPIPNHSRQSFKNRVIQVSGGNDIQHIGNNANGHTLVNSCKVGVDNHRQIAQNMLCALSVVIAGNVDAVCNDIVTDCNALAVKIILQGFNGEVFPVVCGQCGGAVGLAVFPGPAHTLVKFAVAFFDCIADSLFPVVCPFPFLAVQGRTSKRFINGTLAHALVKPKCKDSHTGRISSTCVIVVFAHVATVIQGNKLFSPLGFSCLVKNSCNVTHFLFVRLSLPHISI